jgi:hypothetical protein
MNILSDVFSEVRAASARLLASPLDLQEMWLNQFAQAELLIAPAHIHTGRPFRFVQIARDGALHDVRVIGVRDLAALKASLGEFLEESSEGGAPVLIQRRYQQDPEPLYLCVISQDMIVSTKRRDLLAPAYRPLYEALAVTRLEGLGGARFFPQRMSAGWGGTSPSARRPSLRPRPLRGLSAHGRVRRP